MKTRILSRQDRQGGYALALVIVFIGVGITLLAATLWRASTTISLNERNNQYLVNMAAAEGAAEKIVARMQTDYRNGKQALVLANLASYRTNTPGVSESTNWSKFAFISPSGAAGQVYVYTTNTTGTQSTITLPSPYAGLYGLGSVYRVIATVYNTSGRYVLTNAVQEDLALVEIPATQYAIFYNGLMEFTWAAPLVVRGRVHANGSIYTGSASDLEFEDPVTASQTVEKKAWAGYALSAMTGDITYDDTVTPNANTLNLPIGTTNSSDSVREIIQMPPSGEGLTNDISQLRFYNQAQLTIVVSNNSVSAWVRDNQGTSYTKSNAVVWSQLSSFVSTNQTFKDDREGKIMRVTQIDVGKMTTWASTSTNINNVFGSGTKTVPNIVYVADMRTSNSTYLSAIRLTNGTVIPTNNSGLTIVTPNPLYVQGNYNVPNSSDLNTTNTANTMPAMLVSDALTILSSQWNDTNSFNGYTKSTTTGSGRNQQTVTTILRNATATTINAAIITGAVDSAGTNGASPFSGGAMNITRLLENWDSQQLTLNTSIIKLFSSARATGSWQTPGTYYNAPNRDFNFDNNFRDVTKLPPGTPTFRVPIVLNWYNPPPGVTNYTGP